MKHKLLSILLCLAMALSLLPTAALAEEATGAGPIKVGETSYSSFSDAVNAAEPDGSGVITYEISGKVDVTATGWVQVAKAGLTGPTKVKFVGKTGDAEICITGGLAILADQKYDIDVSFTNLKLSKPNPTYGGDYGHSTNYFTCWLRNTGAAENTVTYTNCTFPNGVCNNQYGKTVFNNCQFTNSANYNLWNYGGNTEVKNSAFTGVRGIKTYNEGTLAVAPTVKIEQTTFSGLTEKAAIVASKATDITLTNVTATGCIKGLLQKDIEGSTDEQKVTIEANGTGISGDFNITAEMDAEAAKNEFNITAGTFPGGINNDYLAPGANFDATTGEVKMSYVAKIGDTEYPTLADAFAAANKTGDTVIELLDDINMTGKNWTPVGVDGYHGQGVITLNGNGKTITGLSAPLFAGGFAGTSGIVVKNLTLTNVTINDSTSNQGIGAFINNVDSMPKIELDNCHLTNSAITSTGGARVGGLIGWTSGYNNPNDGPVDTYITVKNCSVENTEITAKGSVGGIIGHAGCNPATFHTFTDNTVTDCKLNSTDDGGWRVGVVVGTANVGEISIADTTESNNTLTQADKTAPKGQSDLYGRFVPGTTGKLVIDGVAVFNSDIVAAIGNTGYKTLPEAVAAADNNTVTLLKDVTADITIPAGKTITLDLNGKKLTVPTDAGILVQGKLTVTGNGTVTCEKTPFMVDAGELIIENGAVNSDKDYGIYAKNGGQITVNGGTLTSSFAVLSGNNTTGDMNFTVNGGTLTSKSSEAIYMPGQQTLIINGGVINGGISARMGQITVNGGVINGMTASQTADAMKDYYNYSGSAWIGDAIYVWGGTYKSDNANGNKTNLTINGGTINGNAHRAIAIYDIGTNYEQEISVNISNANVSGDVVLDKTYGNHTHNVTTNISITGGLFSSDPSAYVAAGHYVDASNNGDYPYTVKEGTKPAGALIVVKDKTEPTVSGDITGDNKTAIDNVIGKANVDGVTEAAKKADIVTKSGVTVAENDKVEIEVAVKVEAKAADLANGKLTFEASPVATVTVTKANGDTETKSDVKVSNSMLNNNPITVKLPLPTVDGKLFTPKQILHKFTGGGYEYFINAAEGAKRGAQQFTVENGCAVFTIYGFSTFELSGTVTYVEPSSGGGSSSSSRRYDVSAPSVKHGDVTVSPKTASKGDTVTITVKPDSGYELDTLTVKDASGSKIKVKDKGDGKFTFTMPASKVTVSAEFAEIETLDFADVSTDAYYYEAVKWAAKKGITGGTGDGTFNPNGACTRAHIVTFLWRAAGSPAPKSTVSFADVPAGSYYAKAVAWAVENGITLGTGDGTFSPNATCTRAQSVTFLYRALGTAPTTVNGFTDVTADAFYADAVAWAVESGVTNGTSASTFSPNNGCTRAQIVTFLFRAYQGK